MPVYLEALNAGNRIALDLRDLRVLMRAGDDANLTAPLPLWQGASIVRRDDVFTNGIIMASLGTSAHVTASLGNVTASVGGDPNG